MARVALQGSPLSAKPSVNLFAGSAGRTLLRDITNTGPQRQKSVLKSVSEEVRLSLVDANDYARLLKENASLLMMIEERNAIIEYSNNELQKFKVAVQKLQQQNWNLALSYSKSVTDLNAAKDNLIYVQHQLSCSAAVLKTKTLELEELKEKVRTILGTSKIDDREPLNQLLFSLGTETIDDSQPATARKQPSRKRTSATSQALCTPGNVLPADNDDELRRSKRRRSSTCVKSQLSEPEMSVLPEVEEPMNEDQPLNRDEKSITSACDKRKDKQEMKNSTSNKIEQKQSSSKVKDEQEIEKQSSSKVKDEQEIEKQSSSKGKYEQEIKSPTSSIIEQKLRRNKGKDEQETKNPTKSKIEQKQSRSKGKYEQEIRIPTSRKVEQKQTRGKGKDEQEIKKSTGSNIEQKQTRGKGKDEQEIKKPTSSNIEQKQTNLRAKRGRTALNSQANEPAVADLAEVKETPPKEGMVMNLASQPSSTELGEGNKTCQTDIRNQTVNRTGRMKEDRIICKRKTAAKDKEHKTGMDINSKQNPVVIEDSPTGQIDISSANCPSTELTAEIANNENVATVATGDERKQQHERKSLPVETTAEAQATDGGRPSRRATIGVSYKERPINIKMRRPS